MMRNPYVDELLNNYQAFYLMTRSAAMLGTKNSEQLDLDAQTVIGFLGQVYGWRQELIDSAADLIINDMMCVGLLSDYRALASAELLDESVKDHMALYEVKGAALEEVTRSELAIGSQLNDRAAQEIKNSMMSYQAFHHVYEPAVRYAHLKSRADSGEPVSTLQTALMRILGIGCERNIAYAQRLLERALLWGQRESAKILSFLWAQEGDMEMRSFFESIYTYLSGESKFPELPEDTKAAEYCIMIAAVRSAVRRHGGSGIDILFADLINRDGISFNEKLTWISRYKDGMWLKRYFTGQKPMKIGFLH